MAAQYQPNKKEPVAVAIALKDLQCKINLYN
jgi:hypothetical protein